jgi:hypothetical protein
MADSCRSDFRPSSSEASHGPESPLSGPRLGVPAGVRPAVGKRADGRSGCGHPSEPRNPVLDQARRAGDETTLTHLKTIIADAILYFEPRIVLEDVTFDTTDIADGVLLIDVVYWIEMTNSRSNLVIPYYFLEGTLARLE